MDLCAFSCYTAVSRCSLVSGANDTGDVNGHGKINAALQYSVGKIKRKEEEKQAANTTGDHAPNAKDALCILQKTVGSIRYFPVEKKPVAWN